MPTESSLLINVNEILSFFDEKPDLGQTGTLPESSA